MLEGAVSEFVDVTGVRVLDRFVLELEWADGLVTRIDAEPYLRGPVFEPLRDPAMFATVTVNPEAGTIVWPGTGADISPEELRLKSRPVRSHRLDARELTGRFRRLPPVDPQRLRKDVESTVDQRSPRAAPQEGHQ